LPAELAAQTLPGGSLLGSLLLAGLQVKGMFLDLFDDVFLLDLALESLQRAFQGFTILYDNFCQSRDHLLVIKTRMTGRILSPLPPVRKPGKKNTKTRRHEVSQRIALKYFV
jgi:hypothetical protein